MMSSRNLFTLAAVISFFAMCAETFAATTNSWNWGHGLWQTSTNWTNRITGERAAPTTNTDFVTITYNNPLAVTIDPTTPLVNLTVNSLLVSNPAQSSTYFLVASNLAGTGPFRVLKGARFDGASSGVRGRFVVTNSTVIFDGAAGDGDVTFGYSSLLLQTNAEMILTNGATLFLGNERGTRNNVSAFATNSGGTLRILNTNLVIGTNANGTFVQNGGFTDVGLELTLGEDAGSTGTVVVARGEFRALSTNANTAIGRHGVGLMTTSNGFVRLDDVSVGRHDGSRGTWWIYGGTNSMSDLSIGRFTNSWGAVTNAGGVMLCSGDVFVGREGTGTLTMVSGTLQAQNLQIAPTNGSAGSVNFSNGIATFAGSAYVGSPGSTGSIVISGGAFTITNADNGGVLDVIRGTVTVRGGTSSWDTVLLTNPAGRLVITGGMVNVDQFVVTNGSPLVLGNGSNAVTVRFTGGGSSFADGLIINSNVTVIGSGAVSGAVTNYGTIVADGAPFAFIHGVTNLGSMLTSNGGSFRTSAIGVSNTITRVQRIGGTTRTFFTTTNGAYYTLQFKNSLSDRVWIPLSTALGSGATLQLDDPAGGDAQRIYRIRIQ